MKNKRYTLLILSVLICICSLFMMSISLMQSDKRAKAVSFTPPPFDSQAVQGMPSVPENLGWGEIDAQVYKALICGAVILDGNTADLWFTNPDSNTIWLKLRVLDSKGNIIGETGIIKPGEYVQSVNFTSVPKEGDAIELKLMGYEPETYYSAGGVTLTTIVTGGDKC